jgi:hypothetical protein
MAAASLVQPHVKDEVVWPGYSDLYKTDKQQLKWTNFRCHFLSKTHIKIAIKYLPVAERYTPLD